MLPPIQWELVVLCSGMKWQEHLVPRLRIIGTVPLLPIHDFMMWATFPCLIKYEGKNAATLQAILLNFVHCSNFDMYIWQCFRS